MLLYNIKNNEISFFNDDKRLGKISIPNFSSSLFKEIYIKTAIFLATSNYLKYTKIKLPNIKIPFNKEDCIFLNKFRNILGADSIIIEKENQEIPSLSFLGGGHIDNTKHVLFFSGGKESWYKLLYLKNILKISDENILLIYIDKWNVSRNREAKALISVKNIFTKINIQVIDIRCSLSKKYAYSLEYLLMLAASLEKVFIFNGCTNIHFGFSNISWKNKDTYLDSFSETIEAEDIFRDFLNKYNIVLPKIIRLEVPEYSLYDYKLFNEYNISEYIVSCITPDGLSTLSRSTFINQFPELLEFIDDTMCCFCTKCILKILNKIKYSHINVPREVLVRLSNKHIDNKLIPIQKGKKENQFYNYDIHLLSYIYQTISSFFH